MFISKMAIAFIATCTRSIVTKTVELLFYHCKVSFVYYATVFVCLPVHSNRTRV